MIEPIAQASLAAHPDVRPGLASLQTSEEAPQSNDAVLQLGMAVEKALAQLESLVPQLGQIAQPFIEQMRSVLLSALQSQGQPGTGQSAGLL